MSGQVREFRRRKYGSGEIKAFEVNSVPIVATANTANTKKCVGDILSLPVGKQGHGLSRLAIHYGHKSQKNS